MPAVIAFYRMLLWLYPARSASRLRRGDDRRPVAIPGHLASERVIAACLSLVITSTVLGSLVKVMMYMRPHP
jgi:hypothetical protein